MNLLDHGTVVYDKTTQERINKTVPGMAHFAGTGPENKTCRECQNAKINGHYSKTGAHKGALKPIKCRKFEGLMRDEGPSFDHFREACKYFEEALSPPKAVEGFQL